MRTKSKFLLIKTFITIVLSVSVIVLMMNYRKIYVLLGIEYYIGTSIEKFLIRPMCVLLVIYCWYSIGISVGKGVDLLPIRRSKKAEILTFEIDKVLYVIDLEPVVDFEISFNDEFINVGSASNGDYAHDYFYDKRYYIGSEQFESIEPVKEYLSKISQDGIHVDIVSVDGVKKPELMLNYNFDEIEDVN